MPTNVERFCSLPNILKTFQMVFTTAVMISVSVASCKPPGTEFIWFTTNLMLIIGLITIVLFALQIEQFVVSNRCCSWPLFASVILMMPTKQTIEEALHSILASILYFVSVWLCVNGAENNDDSTSFIVAAFFCFANFVVFGFNSLLLLRIFLRERRRADGAGSIPTSAMPNYGSP